MDYRIFEQKTHDALALHIRHVAVYCLSSAPCQCPSSDPLHAQRHCTVSNKTIDVLRVWVNELRDTTHNS